MHVHIFFSFMILNIGLTLAFIKFAMRFLDFTTKNIPSMLIIQFKTQIMYIYLNLMYCKWQDSTRNKQVHVIYTRSDFIVVITLAPDVHIRMIIFYICLIIYCAFSGITIDSTFFSMLAHEHDGVLSCLAKCLWGSMPFTFVNVLHSYADMSRINFESGIFSLDFWNRRYPCWYY